MRSSHRRRRSVRSPFASPMADHVPALSTPLDRSLLRGGCVHGGNNHGCTHPPHPSAAGRLFPWVQQMDRGERSGDEDRDPLSLLPTHVVTRSCLWLFYCRNPIPIRSGRCLTHGTRGTISMGDDGVGRRASRGRPEIARFEPWLGGRSGRLFWTLACLPTCQPARMSRLVGSHFPSHVQGKLDQLFHLA
jgi:hypothetical protein